jgi:hypothetical protein
VAIEVAELAGRDAERRDFGRRVRQQVDTDGERRELARGLDDARLDAALLQRERGAEPADAGACHQYPQLRSRGYRLPS